MSHLVIVEDDDRIAAPLMRALDREGYSIERFDHGVPAVDRIPQGGVDLVLLDLGLPDVDGLDVCRRIRSDGYAGGVLILTARDDELDRVVGLDSGADDYLAKPFALAELLARVRALLRRSQTASLSTLALDLDAPARPVASPPSTGGFRIDRSARRVWAGDHELALTPKEFDLLALLDASPGAVLTREHIISEVWDENWFGPTRMLDATLGRLRQKLDDAGAPVQITTVRGVGFRIDRDATDA